MSPELNEVRRWLEKADHDRAGAEAALQHTPPVTDIAAFHCQQAVEKMLKGFLLHLEQPFERTHDLVELLAVCENHDAAFEIFRDSVGTLTPYAVRFRYPGPADPTLEEAQSAFATVKAVWTFVLDRVPASARP